MIDKNLFFNSIKAIQKMNDYEREIHKLNQEYDIDCDIIFPTILEDHFVKVLDSLFPKSDNLVDYFIYELDFGNSWKPNMALDPYGNDIKLKTIDDLWNALQEDEKRESKPKKDERFDILLKKHMETMRKVVAAEVIIKAAGLEDRYKKLLFDTEKEMEKENAKES